MCSSRCSLSVSGGELGGWCLVQRAMRSDVVVIGPPFFDGPARVVERREPMTVQALEPKLAVEALDESVLVGLARLDESQLDAALLSPSEKHGTCEFRAVVRDDALG